MRKRRRRRYNGRHQSIARYDKRNGHHRSHRPGHAFKGVARELERAQSFLVKWRYQESLNPNFPAFKMTVQFTLNES